MDPAVAAVVDGVLSQFTAALRARDLEAALDVLSDDPAVLGSTADERAVGREEVARFLGEVMGREASYAFEWDEPLAGDQRGDVIWFVAPARAVLVGGAEPQVLEYRIGGTLVHDGTAWRLALFNGSEPAAG